jgi:hypothetical protein
MQMVWDKLDARFWRRNKEMAIRLAVQKLENLMRRCGRKQHVWDHIRYLTAHKEQCVHPSVGSRQQGEKFLYTWWVLHACTSDNILGAMSCPNLADSSQCGSLALYNCGFWWLKRAQVAIMLCRWQEEFRFAQRLCCTSCVLNC